MNRSLSWFRGGIIACALLASKTAVPAVHTVGTSDDFAPIVRELALDFGNTPPMRMDPTVDRPFPALAYGKIDGASCLRELDARAVTYERVHGARGVSTPVRLMAPLRGVTFINADAVSFLASAKREVMDCRLLLALDDFAAMLSPRGITKVEHYGVYRGDLPLPKRGRPLHHLAGLAIDVAAFVKDDDARASVLHDWSRRLGPRSCDSDVSGSPSENAIALHEILCQIVRQKTFQQVLTPNHDSKHRDHWHLEVMRGTEWSLVE